MQITLTKEQVKEAFGELRYMGADYCYRYDKETRKKTEEVEALRLHLGSMKLGIDDAKKVVEEKSEEAISLLQTLPNENPYLEELLIELIHRKK